LGIEAIDCRELVGGITVKVKVQPRASKIAITGIVGDSLKLALTSPPVDGAANEACVLFFSDLCGVSKSQIAIISGLRSREKIIRILSIDKAGFFSLLNRKYKID
jgi:uncharacterized protein (TIGR00251 family)